MYFFNNNIPQAFYSSATLLLHIIIQNSTYGLYLDLNASEHYTFN